MRFSPDLEQRLRRVVKAENERACVEQRPDNITASSLVHAWIVSKVHEESARLDDPMTPQREAEILASLPRRLRDAIEALYPTGDRRDHIQLISPPGVSERQRERLLRRAHELASISRLDAEIASDARGTSLKRKR